MKAMIFKMISIIVPVYNVEEYLECCINSILSQTYSDFELLLIDDGSTDNSGIICDKFEKIDSRITTIHKENEGQSVTRNLGISLSHGEYLMFIDSDDYIHSNMLKILLSNFNENTDIVACGFQRVFDSEQDIFSKIDCTQHIISLSRDEIYDKWHYVETNVVWNKLFRKSIFENIRFPIGMINEDEYIKPSIDKVTTNVIYISLPLYFYRQRKNSTMRSKFSIKRMDKLEAIYKNIEYFNSIKSKFLDNELEYFSSYYFRYVFKLMYDKQYTILKRGMYKKRLFDRIFPLLIRCKLFTNKYKFMLILYRFFPKLAAKRYAESYMLYE